MNWAVSIGVTWLALAAGAVLTQEVPIRSTPQNEPCPDQPTTVEEARDAFSASRQPGLSEIAGTWVAIGMLSDSSSLNCSGVTRGPVFEWVMAAEEDVLEIDMIGMHAQSIPPKLVADSVLTGQVDFGGDSAPEYHCRLTERETLICLAGRDPWMWGVEFKRMTVRTDQRASSRRTGGEHCASGSAACGDLGPNQPSAA